MFYKSKFESTGKHKKLRILHFKRYHFQNKILPPPIYLSLKKELNILLF